MCHHVLISDLRHFFNLGLDPINARTAYSHGDHEYRREMVPVYVKRTLRAALAGAGPVHHI